MLFILFPSNNFYLSPAAVLALYTPMADGLAQGKGGKAF
jgi:hypothetical protein